MKVTARGWSRDHGAKELLTAHLAYETVTEDLKSFSRGQTYFEVRRNVHESPRGRRRVDYKARVSAHAELNLNGSYLVQLELDRDEVTRLFYLMNGDRALPQLLETFSGFTLRDAHGLPKEQSS
jgi:hypothetical protein